MVRVGEQCNKKSVTPQLFYNKTYGHHLYNTYYMYVGIDNLKIPTCIFVLFIHRFLMEQEGNARWHYGVIQEMMSQAWWQDVRKSWIPLKRCKFDWKVQKCHFALKLSTCNTYMYWNVFYLTKHNLSVTGRRSIPLSYQVDDEKC